MRYLVMVLFLNSLRSSTMDVISTRYCPDMRPQSYVTIEQLLGMWFGVELINHKQNQERLLSTHYVSSCPVIHLSEDHSPTVPPFYRGGTQQSYGDKYGTYQSGNYQQRKDYENQGSYSTEYYPTDYDYEDAQNRRTSHSYPGYKYNPEGYPRRYPEEIKRLRLLWTDSGNQIEYTLGYNISAPGFWTSPAFKNEPPLKPQHKQFQGKVQVIKAVGNHLVLTFCHELPNQQLYTIVLSRKPQLTGREISDVHELLTGRSLEINNITQVCSQNGGLKLHVNIFLLVYIIGTSLELQKELLIL